MSRYSPIKFITSERKQFVTALELNYTDNKNDIEQCAPHQQNQFEARNSTPQIYLSKSKNAEKFLVEPTLLLQGLFRRQLIDLAMNS